MLPFSYINACTTRQHCAMNRTQRKQKRCVRFIVSRARVVCAIQASVPQVNYRYIIIAHAAERVDLFIHRNNLTERQPDD